MRSKRHRCLLNLQVPTSGRKIYSVLLGLTVDKGFNLTGVKCCSDLCGSFKLERYCAKREAKGLLEIGVSRDSVVQVISLRRRLDVLYAVVSV